LPNISVYLAFAVVDYPALSGLDRNLLASGHDLTHVSMLHVFCSH